MERASPEQVEQTGRRRRLGRKDRQLVGALGLCRYLTIRQVIELGLGAKTGKVCRSPGRITSPVSLVRIARGSSLPE